MKILLLTTGILTHALFANSRLINGTPANKADWPVSVYASMSQSRCSATLVGPQTLLIAAHCVKDAGTASFTLTNRRISTKCKHSPNYATDSTADWALCYTASAITGVTFENLNYDLARIKVGDKLTLTGYGCTTPGGGGGNDGIFRVGQSTIKRLPNTSSNDIITKNGAALCFGDSGGAAYYVDPRTNQRWIVGVNSRANISTTSYLSSVHTDKAKDFFKSWAITNNTVICGIHSEAVGCRP